MDQLISSIELSLLGHNYVAAVISAVIIPDICGKAEYTNKHYKQWFEANMDKVYRSHITGSDAYAIRCALIHAFDTDLSEHKARERLEKFDFTLNGSHLISSHGNVVNGVMQPATVIISAKQYATDIIEAYKSWKSNYKIVQHDKESYVSFANDGDIGGFIHYS